MKVEFSSAFIKAARKLSNHTYPKGIFRNTQFPSSLSYSIPYCTYINTIGNQS